MQSSTLTQISPSFSSHSSNSLADVAARVISEFRQNNNDYDHILNFKGSSPQKDFNGDDDKDNDNDNNDDEFEFAIHQRNSNSSCHDPILPPQYPLFDTSLLLTVADPNLLKLVTQTVDINNTKSLVVRLPLIKLFNEDRDFLSSSTSSEADDDLEGLTPDTYCVWKPKTNSQEKCNSGNSSRRWRCKLRDILPSSQGLLGAFSTVSWSNRSLRPF